MDRKCVHAFGLLFGFPGSGFAVYVVPVVTLFGGLGFRIEVNSLLTQVKITTYSETNLILRRFILRWLACRWGYTCDLLPLFFRPAIIDLAQRLSIYQNTLTKLLYTGTNHQHHYGCAYKGIGSDFGNAIRYDNLLHKEIKRKCPGGNSRYAPIIRNRKTFKRLDQGLGFYLNQAVA